MSGGEGHIINGKVSLRPDNKDKIMTNIMRRGIVDRGPSECKVLEREPAW